MDIAAKQTNYKGEQERASWQQTVEEFCDELVFAHFHE